MISVRIPTDNNFNYSECKRLYEKYQMDIRDPSEFSDVVLNTFFYSFFDDDKFIGCIYYYHKQGKLFVNAVAERHTHLINLECLKMTFKWFNCDIYAETRHKTAILCLYRLGFKKIGQKLYIKENK